MKVEKYDIKAMLKDIERESPETEQSDKAEMSQSDISKLINERKKPTSGKNPNTIG